MNDELARLFVQNSKPITPPSFGPQEVCVKDSEASRRAKIAALAQVEGPPVKSLSPQEERAVALVAEVHEKTVARYISGFPVRPGSRVRIERALARIEQLRLQGS